MRISATEMKNNLGKYLKACQNEDVFITKNDKVIARLSGSGASSAEGYVAMKEAEAAYTAFSYSGKKVSYEDFIKITEGNEERYEYIDGEVYLLASPGYTHQVLHSRLFKVFMLWFDGDGKKCRVLSAPFDITLSKNVVQPDLMVTCDHAAATDKNDRYTGIPSLVVEIVSPQTRSRDFVGKLKIYQEGGVNEYWIVDQLQKQIIIFSFADRKIDKVMVYKLSERAESMCFKGLTVQVSDIMNSL